jgi:hypothetical protein
MARVAVASAAVTLTLAYVVGAAAVVAAWSPGVEVEPASCSRSIGDVGPTVTDL